MLEFVGFAALMFGVIRLFGTNDQTTVQQWLITGGLLIVGAVFLVANRLIGLWAQKHGLEDDDD